MGGMGIVKPGTIWKLRKAVYGLRQSPKWWSDERDDKLREVTWTHGGASYRLQQNEADSQVWSIIRDGDEHLCGLLCVYVDDMLVLMEDGATVSGCTAREAFVNTLLKLWEFGGQRVLSPEVSFTFLGLDWYMRPNGDIYLSQERFINELLEKHGKAQCNPAKAVSSERPPEQPSPPNEAELTQLQAYAGAFNWLVTRTRPDVSYYTSLLASSCSHHGKWSC